MKALGREGEMLNEAEPVKPGDWHVPGGGWYMLRVTSRPPSLGKCRGQRLEPSTRHRELDITRAAGGESAKTFTPMRGEYVVEMVLRRKGFDAWAPSESYWVQQNRYRRSDKKVFTRPILTGYVLVRLDEHPNWPRVLGFPMIRGVVGFGSAPARVIPGGIAKLRRIEHRSQAKVYQRLMPTHRTFEVGDEVEILDGSLEGMTVRVAGLVGDAAVYELMLFGRLVSGTIPLHKIGSLG